MKYFFLCFFLWMGKFAFGQHANENPSKWTLKTGYSIGTAIAIEDKVTFFLCFEGCNPTYQRLKSVQQFRLSAAYSLTKDHRIGLGLNAMFHDFDQTLFFNVIGGEDVRGKYPMKYGFAGISAFHEWDILSFYNIGIFLQNGLLFNFYLDQGKGYNFTDKTLDYQTGLMFQKMLGASLGLEAGPYFATAMTPYNDQKYNKNFFPYHFGMKVNLLSKF